MLGISALQRDIPGIDCAMKLNERERSILKILARYKGQPIDLEEVRQQYGYGVARFMSDWKGLVDKGLVVGLPTTEGTKRVIGTGCIALNGKEALHH
jgi:hypothetical protein